MASLGQRPAKSKSQSSEAPDTSCTMLRGIARGGAQCVAGRCVVTACRFGFVKGFGECIPW